MASVCRAEETPNTCWDPNGQNAFSVVFTGGAFSSGKAGTTADFSYTLPSYMVSCWSIISSVFPMGSIAYQSVTGLPTVDGTFLKVNEDFDIRIFTKARYSGRVPTTDYAAYDNITFPTNKRFSYSTNFGGASVTLRLRRDQLGGALHIPPLLLFKAHSVLTSSMNGYNEVNVKNNTPVVSISTAEQFIPLPVVCQINNSVPIEVDFGDIDNTKITRDGSRYIKMVPLRYGCNTPITQNINIHLVATPSSFSSDFLASSMQDDVGVVVKYNGRVLKPNDKFETILINGKGEDLLQVAPVINDPTKSVTGVFTASATLILTVQ